VNIIVATAVVATTVAVAACSPAASTSTATSDPSTPATAQAARDEDYRVTVADVQAFGLAHGAIPANAVLFIATGWDARWPDAARYINVRAGVKHFPGLSVDAARYLAADRTVAASASIWRASTTGRPSTFEAHQTTMPIKIAGGSGDRPGFLP
jgi:kynurenine formamidase